MARWIFTVLGRLFGLVSLKTWLMNPRQLEPSLEEDSRRLPKEVGSQTEFTMDIIGRPCNCSLRKYIIPFETPPERKQRSHFKFKLQISLHMEKDRTAVTGTAGSWLVMEWDSWVELCALLRLGVTEIYLRMEIVNVSWAMVKNSSLDD